MTALFGWLKYDHHGRVVSRSANREISAILQTRRGRVEMWLWKDGACQVVAKPPRGGPGGETSLWEGNLHTVVSALEESPLDRIVVAIPMQDVLYWEGSGLTIAMQVIDEAYCRLRDKRPREWNELTDTWHGSIRLEWDTCYVTLHRSEEEG